MNFTLLDKLAVFGVVLFVLPACQKSSPVRPSLAAPSLTEQTQGVLPSLTGLSGSFVGMANEICEGGAAVAIDDLTVNYSVSGKSLVGALLVACDSADCRSGSPLGTVTKCPMAPNPCEAGLPQAVSEGSTPACLAGDPTGTGSVRVYAARPAHEPGEWLVMACFGESGDHTNTVSGTVEQTP